jgi:hypothetical protein
MFGFLPGGEMNRGILNPDDYKFREIVCKGEAGSGGKGASKGSAPGLYGDAEPYIVKWRGAVVVPLEVDTQKEASEKADIEKQMIDWFTSQDHSKVDTNHDYKRVGVVPYMSYIAEKGDANWKEGTWVLGCLTRDPDIGERVKSGELNAFSWSGPVDRELGLARISHPIEASGTTEKSDGGPYSEHDHEIEKLKFNDDAKVERGWTKETFGHRHEYIGTTRTEKKDGHSHGMKIVPQG